MSPGIRQGFSRVGAFLDLLASVAAFSAAVWLYWGSIGRGYVVPGPVERFREILISAFTAWVAMAFAENPGRTVSGSGSTASSPWSDSTS